MRMTADVTAVLDCSATSVACAACPATCWIDAESSVTAVVELSILSVWSLSPPSISRDAPLISALDAPGQPFHDPEADRALFDGLEYVAGKVGFLDSADESPAAKSPLADYSTKGVENDRVSGGLAGIGGSLLVLVIAGGLFRVLRRRDPAPARDPA